MIMPRWSECTDLEFTNLLKLLIDRDRQYHNVRLIHHHNLGELAPEILLAFQWGLLDLLTGAWKLLDWIWSADLPGATVWKSRQVSCRR